MVQLTISDGTSVPVRQSEYDAMRKWSKQRATAGADGAATSAPAQPVIINVHVAGRNVAQALLPDLAQAIRSGAGLRI